MHYTSVLFDLDGTLLDTLGDLTAAMNRTLTRHGLPERTRQQMRTALGNGARRLMELSVPSGTDSALFETLLAEYNADYAAHCRIETAPYPGVAALLRTLHAQGRKLAIVSNKPDEAVRALRADFFADTISIAVGEKAGIRRKPAPDTVFRALEELGAGTGRAVYVGDSDVDIQTAANAGLPCLSVSWGFRDAEFLTAHGAQRIVDTPQALEALLLGA